MARREPVFEVFARIAPGDPMSHIGTLNAPGIELARVYAWRIYDEEDWSEMWVAPRDAIVSAHPDQERPEAFRNGTESPDSGPA